MKKLLATACFALLGAGAFAQTTQGTTVVSGSIGTSSQSYTRQDNSNYEGNSINVAIHPRIGYFYKDGIEVGVSTGFSFYNSRSGIDLGETGTKGYTINVGPYITKYFPITEKLYFTAGGHVGVGFSQTFSKASDKSSYDRDLNSFTYTIGAAPGLSYFATEKLGFFINVGQLYFSRSASNSKTTDAKSTQTYFSADVSLSSSSIGIRYLINR